jgi:sugar lactone lactonase YvrE
MFTIVRFAIGLVVLQLLIAGCSSSSLDPASDYEVSTLVDATGDPIPFRRPEGLAIDSDGALYVAESLGGIWRVSPDGIVENLVAGEAISLPAKMALGDDGTLYVTESAVHRVISVSIDGTLSTVAGTGETGYVDGDAAQAQFFLPLGIAVDPAGSIYVADSGNNRIRQITAGGQVSTLAGGERGYSDGPGDTARFSGISGLAIDEAGTLYVAEADGERVRTINPDGVVSTLAGNGEVGFADGPADEAWFNGPTDVALDETGNIYVADLGNHSLRLITTEGLVKTIAGNGEPGYVDGPGPEARFWFPQAVVVDASGIIYVADSGNGIIRIVKKVITP